MMALITTFSTRLAIIVCWTTLTATLASTSDVGRGSAAAAATTTTHTWSFTTFWSPYYSYWPIVYEMNDVRPVRFGQPERELATNRLFPSHPTVKTHPTTPYKLDAMPPSSSSSTSYLNQAVKPEHRLFPSSLRPLDLDNGQAIAEHRYFSYISSSPSPSPSSLVRTLKKRSSDDLRNQLQLPISSTSVVFLDSVAETGPTHKAENKESTTTTELVSQAPPEATKSEGKLVMEGLNLIGSLLRPGSRPSLLSASSSGSNNILGQLLSGSSSSSGGHPNPFLASSATNNHPFLASPPTSTSSFLQHYSPLNFGGLHQQPFGQDWPPFMFPGPNALYSPAVPFPSLHHQLHHHEQQPSSNPYYAGMPPSPYQALGVDNLLVPLVGMIGLNLLRPDIIKSRREGMLSDLDGIDVFRNLELSDSCLRRLACESGVTVADSDDAEAIQRALERALAARRLVPSRHVGRKSTDVKRMQCGAHSCASLDQLANAATSSTERIDFKKDTSNR